MTTESKQAAHHLSRTIFTILAGLLLGAVAFHFLHSAATKNSRLRELGEYGDFMAMCSGIVAFFLAALQMRDMERVTLSLSTRFAGEFPENLREVKNLLARVESGDTVDVLVDCSDYGSFWAPGLHSEVMNLMATAGRDASVRILVSGPLTPLTGDRRPIGELLHGPSFSRQLSVWTKAIREDAAFATDLNACGSEPSPFIEWLTEFSDEPISEASIKDGLMKSYKWSQEDKELRPKTSAQR